MGANCEKCCANTDENTEFDDKYANPLGGAMPKAGMRQSRDFTGKSNGALGSLGMKQQLVRQSGTRINLSEKEVMQVIRLQAIVRGFLKRRQYRTLSIQANKSNVLYFKKEELMETVKGSQNTYNPEATSRQVKYRYQTGSEYEGEMKGGFRDGHGVMTWTDGAKYSGMWKEGFACGRGVFYHADGDTYDGDWFNNKCNGVGTYKNVKGAEYHGDWKNDTQWGMGHEVWPEGSKYKGRYVDGKKCGHGRYEWLDGAVYEGSWEDNKINGVGYYMWNDGRKYYGSFLDNDMHGVGLYFYVDGVTYRGQYSKDKKEGYGFYSWPDKRSYQGWWHKGKQHGLGIYRDPTKNKEKYGLWENGRRLQWFSDDQIRAIISGNRQFLELLQEQQSIQSIPQNSTFDPPMGLEKELSQLQQQLNLTAK